MSEKGDGESFSDISCASTEINSTSTAPEAKKSRRDETGSSMLQLMTERAAKTDTRAKTFLEGMNMFSEDEKFTTQNRKISHIN